MRVVSAPLLDLKYSPSSLDEAYGSKDDSQDPEAVAEGTGLLLSTLSGLLTGTHQRFAQNAFSTHFRKAYWYCVV